MKVLLICPVPAEFNACREVLRLRELPAGAACRAGRAVVGNVGFTAVESGPGRARAAAATAAACREHQPGLVVDSGSCAGLDSGAAVGQMVLATVSYEYGIVGGMPARDLPATKLPAALAHLDGSQAEELRREAVEIGGAAGVAVRMGPQACGELVVQSASLRRTLYALFRAVAANWESAGIFNAASKCGLPAISIRVITDLGDGKALRDFRKHFKGRARELYGYIRDLAELGWFARLAQHWSGLDPRGRRGLAATVWPGVPLGSEEGQCLVDPQT